MRPESSKVSNLDMHRVAQALTWQSLPVASRISLLYGECGVLEMDGHAVVLRQDEDCLVLPVAGAAALLLQPGTTVTHAAVRACAQAGCLLLWVGEAGVRCYAAGNPGRNAEALLRQAGAFSDPQRRLQVARRVFGWMFGEVAPANRSIEQLRGMEGARVKALYREIAATQGVIWRGRDSKTASKDPVNQAISFANASLYGLAEAVILALGYSPAIGFVHQGDARSFVFDLADCVKFRTVVPLAMSLAKASDADLEGRVRRACRDLFREQRLAERLVSLLDDLLAHG